MRQNSIETLAINTIRTLAMDAIDKANSGHPGLPMGAAPMAYVLWNEHLKFSASHPQWPDRDRFVLSAGHGSMLLYSLLHLYGYDLSLDELKNFRQLGSKTPGHPEYALTPGVEATTGPLGQGFANAVGMAIAERKLANLFNRPGFPIVDHQTWSLVGDGCLMEGIAAEAASLAGHLRLGKLNVLYDSNDISLDGPTSLSFTEDVGKRFESYGWHVQTVTDGNRDIDALENAISKAESETTRSSLIIVKTTIGYGSPKQGTSHVHGNPLGASDNVAAKKSLDWSATEPFHIPLEAREHFKATATKRDAARITWEGMFAKYRTEHPDLAQKFSLAIAGDLPQGWDSAKAAPTTGEKIATRKASGSSMNAIAAQVPWLLGGDADLSCSTGTTIKDGGSFEGQTGTGRNIHYGVREHAMAAVANGMSYHGGIRPFVSTFFCFVDYERPSIRLAAMNHLPVIHVWTHDSVWLGEDGPTHQPVEHLASIRCIPNLAVIRPADAVETDIAWKVAMGRKTGPTGLVLTRQNLPVLDWQNLGSPEGVRKGAYVLSEATTGKPKVILMASGSEVGLALTAQKDLEAKGTPTRVVSMPCWELFASQDQQYRNSVLPPEVTRRVSIEAGSTFGWERWVGSGGHSIGIDRFGASAPYEQLMKHLGFTPEAVVAAAQATV